MVDDVNMEQLNDILVRSEASKPVTSEYVPKRPLAQRPESSAILRTFEMTADEIEQDHSALSKLLQIYIEQGNTLARELREFGKQEAERRFQFIDEIANQFKASMVGSERRNKP